MEYFPGITTLQLCNNKVQEFLSKMSENPEEFTGRIIFISMLNDISWRSQDNEQECELSAHLVSIYARRFSPGRWSFLGLGSEKKWYSNHVSKPQGEWDIVGEIDDDKKIQKADTQFSVPRVHCPEERSKAKVVENYQYTSAQMKERLKLFFAEFFSVNQLSVSTEQSQILCEEYKACHVRTGRLVMVEQSDPLFVPTSLLTKTPTPSTDDPAQEDLLQKYQDRVETLSKQNRVIKFCSDAGFLTTVDVGQYFMTNDTEEFSQFTESVACREYTLPRDEKSSDPKGWIRGNTKIGPVLDVTISYLQGKYGVEIRIESVSKGNSHSWVRISHGLNKLVTDLSNKKEDDNNEQETSEMQFEDFALKMNVLAFASRSKAKAKPRRRTLASSYTRTVPIGERTWTDIEPEIFRLSLTQCQNN